MPTMNVNTLCGDARLPERKMWLYTHVIHLTFLATIQLDNLVKTWEGILSSWSVEFIVHKKIHEAIM